MDENFKNDKSISQTDITTDSETDILADLFPKRYFKAVPSTWGDLNSRRVSGTSVASGIYAEIEENTEDIPKFHLKYENLNDIKTDSPLISSSCPPPLPPRPYNHQTEEEQSRRRYYSTR